MELTRQERNRYSRHILLKGMGVEGQLKLKSARVLVVGAGGLGSPVLLYLAAAGIGQIGIADHDTVDISNLQRQILYTENDVGRNKAETAVIRLNERNSLITYRAFPFRLTAANALDIVKDFDVVVDGTDNFPTRYLLNDACVILNKPLVYGSILSYEGHVSVFNLFRNGIFSPNYRDLFPSPPDPETVPDCSQAGVLGVLPGLIGCVQANEVLKVLTGAGEPLAGKLLIFDSLTLEQTIINYKTTFDRKTINYLVDYDEYCGLNEAKNKSLKINPNKTMKEVTVQELKEMMDSGKSFQLIDVREPHEYDICNLGGELIPQAEIPSNVDRISKEKQVVIHCRSGARSGNMVQWLESNHGMTNLYNLKGGVLAWAKEIDPEMPTY
jgi:sulfur-carrier protein adenylyltransferase/sulfurtransferase